MTGWLRAAAYALLTLGALAAGCGGASTPERDQLTIDDAFVVRIVSHQQVSVALAQTAVRDGQRRSVRRLAQRMVTARRRTLPALEARFAEIPAIDQLPDLGVAPAQAGEEIGPDSLNRQRPLDPAFLTVMIRHHNGARALLQAELARGRDPGVRRLAARLLTDLTRELNDMRNALLDLARSRDRR